MKTKRIYLALTSAVSAILTVSAFAQEKKSQAFSPAELTERTLHRRAIEAVIWGMPAMKVVVEFEQSLKKYPPIAPGTADPYKPPKLRQLSKENPKEQ